MKMNLTRKIFIAVMSIFLLVMSVQLIIQNNFLKDIYFQTKKSKVEHMIQEAQEDISLQTIKELDFNDMEKPFFDDLNTSVLFLTQELQVMNTGWLESFNYTTVHLTNPVFTPSLDGVKKKSFEVLNVVIDPAVDESGQFRNFIPNLKTGHKLSGSGRQILGTHFIMPHELYIDGQPINMQENMYSDPTFESKDLIYFEGTMTSFNLRVRDQGIFSYQHQRLFNEFHNLLAEGLIPPSPTEENGSLTYDFIEEQTGFFIFVNYDVTTTADGSPIHILSLSTLENVHDAFKILNGYYLYIFAVQVLLALILVYYFSRKITKPILNLSLMADEISEQNFETTLDIHTGDELEVLSDSLHAISSKLSQNILELENSELRMRNMLSGLSHEFKTPLGIISGFLEIIQDGVGSEPDSYYLSSIELEVARLDDLVRETIDLSHLESGEYKYKPVAFALKGLITRNLSRTENIILENDMRVQLIAEDFKVLGDPKRIDQVFLNLIANACIYSPRSETLSIEIKKEGEYIKTSIVNTGIRLSQDALEHIWDRFYRTDKSRQRTSGGSGLGLTIVKNILELHSSDYGVHNVENGVCFYFTLPHSK